MEKKRVTKRAVKKTKTVRDPISDLVFAVGLLIDRLDKNDSELAKLKESISIPSSFNKKQVTEKQQDVTEEDEEYLDDEEEDIKIVRSEKKSINPFIYVRRNRDGNRRNILSELKEDQKKILAASQQRIISEGFSACYLYILIDALRQLRDDPEYQKTSKGLITVTCDFSSVKDDLTHNMYDPVLKCISIPWIEKCWMNEKVYRIEDNKPSKIPFEFLYMNLMSNCLISFLDTSEAIRDGRSINDIVRDTSGFSYNLMKEDDLLMVTLLTDGNVQSLFYKLKDIKELRERDMFVEYNPHDREEYRKCACNIFNDRHDFDLRDFDEN